MATWEELLAEGAAVPTAGWDFGWFAGRATEERPSWGYARLLAAAMGTAHAALDLQTGGGEVLAEVPQGPPLLVATEGYPPNLPLARSALAPLGGRVVGAAAESELPFRAGAFDLVVARHPVAVRWDEVRRVLRPGGRYLAQHVGAGSVRELTDHLMGPQRVSDARGALRAVEEAEAAGLDVTELRQEALRMEFFDIAAVVHFLRKVVWTVPDFSVARYRARLLALHRFIERHGPFVAYAQRYLIEARLPG